MILSSAAHRGLVIMACPGHGCEIAVRPVQRSSRSPHGGEVEERVNAKNGKVTRWVGRVRQESRACDRERERREWLKKEHKLGTNSAWWIAERAEGKGMEESPEGYLKAAEGWVEAMFSGSRAALRPVYDQLLKVALSVG